MLTPRFILMPNKQEFKRILAISINGHLTQLSTTEKEYVRTKGDNIIDLLIELKEKHMLENLTATKIAEIRQKADELVLNFDHIKKLYQILHKLIALNGAGNQTEIKIKDTLENEYKLNMNQIVTIFAWTYCSLCELIKQYFTFILNNSIGNPTGIGMLKDKLQERQVTNLSFFEDIDNRVRNSFFHFDFKFEGTKIYCKNKSEIYHEYSWRTNEDNQQSEYILLSDLFKLIINADRSSYVMLNALEYLISKAQADNNQN